MIVGAGSSEFSASRAQDGSLEKLLFLGFPLFVSFGPLLGQTPCGTTLVVTVADSTNAAVTSPQVLIDGMARPFSASSSAFSIPCLSAGKHLITVTAAGFAGKELSVTLPHFSPVVITLQPETVETTVDVNGADVASSAGTKTLTGRRLQGLAEDPDELLRQLKQMAASGGAALGDVTVSVDGFQDSSALPAKEDIASVEIDPDLYSAEYAQPPYTGGRVEVHTKPGQKALHGSVFAVNGSPFEDARDPFSVSKAAMGKQRYGGTLTGPVIRGESDFRAGLEMRSISEYAVVNAVTVDAAGQDNTIVQSVETPQQLWLPSASVNLQSAPNNLLILGYTGSLNRLSKVGVGGLALAETGYTSNAFDHVLRFSDILTMRGTIVNDSRFSFRYTGEDDSPLSTAPQIQVAGAFVAGGSALGAQRIHEFKTEFDDSLLLSARGHTLKAGIQMLINNERRNLTTNFNGVYTFGGGLAPVLNVSGGVNPGTSAAITGLEQYRRAVAGLPGGSPTSFNVVSGSPDLRFVQFTNALFIQDEWSVTKRLHASMGLRYFAQTSPTITGAITPRFGFSLTHDAKGEWALHAHAGLFASGLSAARYAEVNLLDGVQRTSSLIYKPVYGNPFSGAVPIATREAFASHFSYTGYTDENVGGTTPLPFGWQLDGDLSFGRIRNGFRSVNVSAPLGNDPFGRRPGKADENLMEEQNSGEGRIDIELLSFSQPHWRRAQVSFGAVRIHQTDDLATPQDIHSKAGEFARSDGRPVWQAFGNLDTTLPKSLHINLNLYASGGTPYNVVTGLDNNGDGVFNDRPVFSSPSQKGALPTPWGYVLNDGTGNSLPRNRGTIPANIHLDLSVERSFKLGAEIESKRSLNASVRSSNLLNHTNVTAVGNIPGSPLFGRSYAASSARRVEAGLRYSF